MRVRIPLEPPRTTFMPKCSTCKKTKSSKQFSTKNVRTGKPQGRCKPCHRLYVKKHYEDNKGRYLERASNNRKAAAEMIRAAKDKPCADCRRRYPYYVMQFDHRKDKKFAISRMAKNNGSVAIKVEIEKCDVVCANCHCIRTFDRAKKVVDTHAQFK